MSQTDTSSRWSYWTGAALGPAAWAIDTQLEYSLVTERCAQHIPFFVALSAVLMVVAFAGAVISWRAAGVDAESAWADASGGGPRTFIAWIGAGSGVIFGLTIANHVAALLTINTC